eukprot:12156415-Alexandrium_andersonii.AAC.1
MPKPWVPEFVNSYTEHLAGATTSQCLRLLRSTGNMRTERTPAPPAAKVRRASRQYLARHALR